MRREKKSGHITIRCENTAILDTHNTSHPRVHRKVIRVLDESKSPHLRRTLEGATRSTSSCKRKGVSIISYVTKSVAHAHIKKNAVLTSGVRIVIADDVDRHTLWCVCYLCTGQDDPLSWIRASKSGKPNQRNSLSWCSNAFRCTMIEIVLEKIAQKVGTTRHIYKKANKICQFNFSTNTKK